MSDRVFRFKQLKALRLIRSGSALDQVCRTLRLQADGVKALEAACRDVPDEILALFERTLSDNEKLRRLIAGLAGPGPQSPIGN